jgi:hypothetical protein
MALIRTPEIVVTSSVGILVVGGLLVGFGTRLGAGCTSGHGVSGLARLSRALDRGHGHVHGGGGPHRPRRPPPPRRRWIMSSRIPLAIIPRHALRRRARRLRHDQPARVLAFLDVAGDWTRPSPSS